MTVELLRGRSRRQLTRSLMQTSMRTLSSDCNATSNPNSKRWWTNQMMQRRTCQHHYHHHSHLLLKTADHTLRPSSLPRGPLRHQHYSHLTSTCQPRR